MLPLNKLLQRQIQKCYTDISNVPNELLSLFQVISESYEHYEKDRKMLERSIELSSEEMIGLNKKLQEEAADLKKSNQELDKFVYIVSHDLRAPLCSVMGIIEITQLECTEPYILENLEMMKGSIQRLDGFVEDILDYSRNARLEIKKEEINFKEMINDISNNLKFMAGSARQVCINSKFNSAAPVQSDKRRMSMVLNNLISNAIRYQNMEIENPFVDIEVNTSDTETDIIVKDNGIGISPELHDKIFEMFYRVSSASVGSGIGLYIVKEAVDAMNGKISLQSEPGKGSEFRITIPNN
jgi:signal transduction histidine kinase